MNYPFITTAVCWETRNPKRSGKAAAWCKDYGLLPLTDSLFIGRLKASERKALSQRFSSVFANRTEAYNMFPLCKTCYENAELSRMHSKRAVDYAPFEVIG